MKTVKMIITLVTLSIVFNVNAQTTSTLAVLDIDTKGLLQDPKSMSDLVRFEFEKTKSFKVLDRYDIDYSLKGSELETTDCYGKDCAAAIGKELTVDKVLTGSVTRFGEKIIFNLRMINANDGSIHASTLLEFYNLQPHIQQMAEIAVRDLLGMPNDELLMKQLAYLQEPVVNDGARLSANGPRMGVAYITDGVSDHDRQSLLSSKGKYPVLTQFGYQLETQYLSTGNFQALFEALGIIGGMDQGLFIPTISFMNGFRNTKNGLEIAFGPTFSITEDPEDNNVELTSGWVWALGKTFKSGNLNIPVNLYCSPDREKGWYLGASFGFNMAKHKRQ